MQKLSALGMAKHGALSFCLHFFSCFLVLAVSQSQPDDQFLFNGFNGSTDSNITLNRASIIKSSGALKLTNRSSDDVGQVFYPRPFRMLAEASGGSTAAVSFSTHFVFAIKPPSSGDGGYGLAFVVAPKTSFPGAQADHYLGLFSSSNDGNKSNHMLVVEFDTVKGYRETSDEKGNHVGININGMESKGSKPAAYNIDGKDNDEEITLESGLPIQGWIEYDGPQQLMNVTISPIDVQKPEKALLSMTVNLTSIFKDSMYVGFSASTGTKRSFHYVLGWSFRMNGTAPPLNRTQLPLPPDQTDSSDSSSSYKPQVIAFIATLCSISLCLSGILFFYTVIKKRMHQENLEDWELDCPHRFRYKDLDQATKGFKQSEVIGTGGFGAVYHGILPTNRCEVAVKKVSRNSIQGMREFVAEIESLGRLRHKNLVNLQGWCKQKDELLLVYDYVPYGSLDSLIFKRKDGFVLNWEQRFRIIKGVAAGLLYLHEEWEQVVIHRDVKSSNVLIDAEMNARLGDFGLARLYEHGKMSHTTHLVGTIGYIAPELARSGKASTSSDMYAFGILLLEVASGRRPTGQFLLMDWVIECYGTGRILDAADPKLRSAYDAEEMEMVLNLGLVCSQYHAQARPTMRQVIRCLNREEPVPVFVDDSSSAGSRRTDGMNFGFLEIVSSDTTGKSHASTSSYVSSSVRGLSSTSLGGSGR
ncbi:hypothetical protein ACJRO7_000877 [Eucalyptus globulus]|uniref:non-specific serine/threonine protein kinase n=1 Tax=Eucalyptus globulus TaxID=34317 RepID=A0ABD3LP27_EUCGL